MHDEVRECRSLQCVFGGVEQVGAEREWGALLALCSHLRRERCLCRLFRLRRLCRLFRRRAARAAQSETPEFRVEPRLRVWSSSIIVVLVVLVKL